MAPGYTNRVEAEVAVVTRDLQLRQAFNTTDTLKNDSIVLFELDAVAGPIKDVKVEFWLEADAAATFTPSWTITRKGAPVTFVERLIPALVAIANPAADDRYEYVYEDLPEGAQLRFNVAQDNNGDATTPIDGALTYLQAS